ncbi:hypothetical protein HII12_003856 [Brettanomyces bruxellensis]|uniref:ATP-dependent RNA helicase DBP10 n=1 Tax=Dekkera bruxellensis TaxID=5007 RepID=A0A8H6BCK0_DEKBR|nr:hypothetical protein HII12_003856 [Brettanomyces bruxellensis]
MYSDNEEDIASSLISKSKSLVDAETGSSPEQSEDENEAYGVQDVILSSDEEEAAGKGKKKQAEEDYTEKLAFPNLEAEDGPETAKEDDARFIEEIQQKAARLRAKSKGKFASFGLSKQLLANIKKKGYRQPTPIQRKTIPLIMESRDVVGMARTGSGKTAAFLVPLIEKLRQHSPKIGVRAIVLSPTRELAIQTYRQLREFSKGTGIRSLLLVGGDSLEDQFSAMMDNPDAVIATPGRLLHLQVEMRLSLKTVEYIVYDEADRLFEMGFSEQLNEILACLPDERQSLLFSATLPKNLVEFAKAGLSNPVLVRLDAESKISENLEMCFITTKKNERDANLLYLLEEVIKMPAASERQQKEYRRLTWGEDEEEEDEEEEDEIWEGEDEGEGKAKAKESKHTNSRRLKPAKHNELPSDNATIIFVPTRHHVEFITSILRDAGFCVAYIYGSLDQHARRRQLLAFRAGVCSILVVTDVAARGIDIPILANVVNYTFPSTPKLFVHRVGRTARAGNRGWAYSIVGETELAYLMDLEVFLGKKILTASIQEKKTEILGHEPPVSYTKRLVLGSVPRSGLEEKQETVSAILKGDYDAVVQQGVCIRAGRMLRKTRHPASADGVRRAKELLVFGWDEQNLYFGKNMEREKDRLLEKFQHRKHRETVFEFAGASDYLVGLMAKRRREVAPVQERARRRRRQAAQERLLGLTHRVEDEAAWEGEERGENLGERGGKGEKGEISEANVGPKTKSFRDSSFYLPHYAPSQAQVESQMSVNAEGGFGAQVSRASFDVAADETTLGETQKQRPKFVWDRKKKRYIKNQDNNKYIIGENGQKIPASLRSGRYDDWKEKHRVDGFRVGLMESSAHRAGVDRKDADLMGGKVHGKFVHKRIRAPKLPDRSRDHYGKQMEKVRKAVAGGLRVKGYQAKKGPGGELRSVDDIRKSRKLKERRRAKNARPSRR